MIMRAIVANSVHKATPADLPRLRELFANANETPYDLVRVAEEKCFGDGVAGAPVTTVFGDFLGCSVTCGRFLRILAVHREHRGRGIATELLRDAYAREARVVGAEAGNYFTPGVPVAMSGFFEKFGRKTAETQNLICATEGEPLEPTTNRERVLDFIEQEFGKIWRFEASRAEAIHSIEDHGVIAGFAAHDGNNKGLGWFGPTGVAKQFRGRGYGIRLVRASLADMRSKGRDHAIIAWTDALGYYAKACAATIHERFATFLIDSEP